MIDAWADKAEAEGLLPELVRRLIAATAELTELVVRGADTSNFPGWDCSVTARVANAWVPADRSRWEMGTSSAPLKKARGDFKTRTDETPADQAQYIAFVFVTPRIWAGKTDWGEQAERVGHWRMVRAYDADDLATWLENAGSVALWFGERLGVRRHGDRDLGHLARPKHADDYARGLPGRPSVAGRAIRHPDRAAPHVAHRVRR